MNILDEFRNRENVLLLRKKIEDLCPSRKITIMEVCGTHTMSIFRYGIRSLLPENIRLLSGPGCPVCVTANDFLDRAFELASAHRAIITTFGDMFRVPGSRSSLQKENSRGADIRIVYSPIESIAVAKENPSREVVFLGVGFETTAPTTAHLIKKAKGNGIRNLSVLSAHKFVPPAMIALCSNPLTSVDAFLCPPHVATVIGEGPFEKLAARFSIPCVITGFEPVDILCGIYMILKQINEGHACAETEYSRLVRKNGNQVATALIGEVFTAGDAEWRGIGTIEKSGMFVSEDYQNFNAENRFDINIPPPSEPAGCICGEILTGRKDPHQCPLFGEQCTPENPVGACMVSSEGTCAAHFKYSDTV